MSFEKIKMAVMTYGGHLRYQNGTVLASCPDASHNVSDLWLKTHFVEFTAPMQHTKDWLQRGLKILF